MSPFPTTRVIHPRWSEHHQPVAEGGMTAQIEFTKPGTGSGTRNDADGSYTPPTRPVVWAGRCRVQADFRPRPQDLADQSTSVQRYLVAIPASATGVKYAHQGRITKCDNDPASVGRVLFVESITIASERFERDLVCTLTATPGTPAP